MSKVIAFLLWFCITTLCDWLIKLAPLSQPIRCKTKTNRASLARVFPRLAPVTCICFEFRLVHCAVFTCCDWPELLLWFWFYDTRLKTALDVMMAKYYGVITITFDFKRHLSLTVHVIKTTIVEQDPANPKIDGGLSLHYPPPPPFLNLCIATPPSSSKKNDSEIQTSLSLFI